MAHTHEHERLKAHQRREANWKKWGPYLSERAWGTVREDYSPTGEAWDFTPHDLARSKTYRWNEDGLAGVSDRHQYLCLSLALWNTHDPILKERLFGLSGPEGNHGEDVKEYYFYLDNTPTHAYMKMLYKYPRLAFPYADLVAENRRRGRSQPEYELLDTGAFVGGYFDITVEYAKAAESDILMRVTAVNRGGEAAPLYLLPMLWFRNTWSWGYDAGPMGDVPGRPRLRQIDGPAGLAVEAQHPAAGTYFWDAEGAQRLLFTENESNLERLYGLPNASPYVKDAFHRYVVGGDQAAINPAQVGTRAAALYSRTLAPGEAWAIRLRLADKAHASPFDEFDAIFSARQAEADEFYSAVQNPHLDDDEKSVQRQAFAGMLWSKELYYYDVEQWLDGDPLAAPPEPRKYGRNHDWEHLVNFDVISMPDKWEYPWYATWDLAFHCLSLSLVDPDFAKRQLELITREWYMHPNGQLPAYEWAFGDVNPPVHAWAAWRVYKIEARQTGQADREFLEGIFHKLLLNFTWWVNRKDQEGRNVFQGGFLGLDNISVFDRSSGLPVGGRIDQSDATAWMAFYSLGMLRIALELAWADPVYQDIASKFFEHFLRIATAMNSMGGTDTPLWDDEDGFFYDVLHTSDGRVTRLKVRSLVGLMSILPVETLEPVLLAEMPDFTRRMAWFRNNHRHLSGNIASLDIKGEGERVLLSTLTRERLASILRYMLDEDEFLSPYGIRSVSKYHERNPYAVQTDGRKFSLSYQPGESVSGLFGGNSNWRGPVWFPLNFLIIESLQKFHHYYGNSFRVEFPTRSGRLLNLWQISAELSRRLNNLFLRDKTGRRPIYGDRAIFQADPHWRDLILFHEYFHGDSGLGLGASHQTGWTGLVIKLLQQSGGHGEV